MKCGRRYDAEQIFCNDCLADMDKYPVNQEAPLVLPHRNAVSTPRRTGGYRRTRKPEERIAQLRSLVRFLCVLIILLSVSLGIMVTLFLREHNQPEPNSSAGQNYSTTSTPATTETP